MYCYTIKNEDLRKYLVYYLYIVQGVPINMGFERQFESRDFFDFELINDKKCIVLMLYV